MNSGDTTTGTVVSASRRTAWVLLADQNTKKANVNSKIEQVIVGDLVEVELRSEHLQITTLRPRRNCFARSLGNKTKEIAANLDLVMIVTSRQLFKTDFIDRLLCVAQTQDIKPVLFINKNDLEFADSVEASIKIYEQIGVQTITGNAVKEDGLTDLEKLFQDQNLKTVLFTGMSGVGKSSMLNRLIPEAQQKIGIINEKSGLGKQTTSLAQACLYSRNNSDNLLIIDSPGIQNFGVSNLTPEQVVLSFPEIMELQAGCEFSDCQHINEPNCAVLEALNACQIASSRYESYKNILAEVKRHSTY